MDIWEWTFGAEQELRKNGNERLADIMNDLPSYVCDDNHNKVDLIYPEALSLAKKQDNPWVEIFIRHWHLQSQVLHRHNVTGSLNEAVDLLEFSSRDKNANCPQSICVVQDLANTYAQKDGPAFVNERIDIALETLERIDPSWPCYDCICDEYITALVDTNKHKQAMDEIRFRREEISKHNGENTKSSFFQSETIILIQQKNYKQAEAVAKNAHNLASGESFTRYKSALTALALGYQGKFEEAENYVLPFNEVLKAQSHYLYWCEYKYLVCKNGLIEDFQELNYCFNTLTKNFYNNGVQRDTLSVLKWHIELALLNHDIFTAQQCVLTAQTIIPKLVKDLGATQMFDELQNQCKQANQQFSKQINLTEKTIKYKLDSEDSLSLDFLNLAVMSFPDLKALQIKLFDALVINGYIQLSIDLASKALDKESLNPPLLRRFGHILLDENKYKEFDLFFLEDDITNQNNEIQLIYLWLAAKRFHHQDALKSLTYLQQFLVINPKSENCLIKIANICAESKQYHRAQDYWTQLIELDEKNHQFHWDRMISSTILKDWESVRESCKELKFKLDSDDGVINQKMGSIRLKFIQEDGSTFNILANRIGPVEAIVYGFRGIEKEQFIGSTVVFDPYSLNNLDQKDDEGYACDEEGFYTYLYPVYKITEKQNYFVFDIDGVHPGKNIWDEFNKIIEDLGAILSVRYVDDYTVTKEGTEDELSAIYSFIACPTELNLTHLNKKLKQWVANNNLIFVWPLLLEKINDYEELKKQAIIEDIYGLN